MDNQDVLPPAGPVETPELRELHEQVVGLQNQVALYKRLLKKAETKIKVLQADLNAIDRANMGG